MKDAAAVDAPAAADFAPVLDMKDDAVLKAEPADVIVVYEPYASTDPMPWPTPQLAHRLRVAASLYHRKIAPTVVLFNDRYTRGPVNLAPMMKIALVSLGVPAANVKAVARGEYRLAARGGQSLRRQVGRRADDGRGGEPRAGRRAEVEGRVRSMTEHGACRGPLPGHEQVEDRVNGVPEVGADRVDVEERPGRPRAGR